MGLQSRVLGQERQNIKLGKARVLFWEHFSLPQDLSPWQGPRKSVLALCWGSSWQLDENDPKLPPLGWQDCPLLRSGSLSLPRSMQDRRSAPCRGLGVSAGLPGS